MPTPEIDTPRSILPARRALRVRARRRSAPAVGAGRGRRHQPDRHIAPQAAGEEPRRIGARRPAPTCSRCPTAGRSCSATAARPCSGTPPRSALVERAQPAPRVRRVLVEVRRGLRRGAAPRRPDVIVQRPGHPPRCRGRSRRCRPLRADPQRDVDRRVDARCDRPAGRRTRSSPSTPRRRPAACGGTRPTSTCTTSRRRSASPPTAGCGSPPARRPPSSASSAIGASSAGCRPRSTSGSRSTTAALDQTYNTPAVATLVMLDEQLRWMHDQRRARLVRRRAAATSAATSTAGPTRREWATPFVADPAKRSAVVGTIDLDPSVSADDVCAALRANGIVDTDGYRKLGRNQLRIGMFPAIEPADVEALTVCIDAVVDQLRSAYSDRVNVDDVLTLDTDELGAAAIAGDADRARRACSTSPARPRTRSTDFAPADASRHGRRDRPRPVLRLHPGAAARRGRRRRDPRHPLAGERVRRRARGAAHATSSC